MLSLLATLGVGWFPLGYALGLPPNHINAASQPNLAQGSPAPLPSSVDPIILANLQLNNSVIVPTPSETPNPFWNIECNPDIVPSGWIAPPAFRPSGDLTDCHRAIIQVTEGGGDPFESHVWTSQAGWSHGSCGVFIIPGRVFSRVNFPRIDIAEIAKEALWKCFYVGGNWGGWAAIGGYFIVLVTGTEQSEKQG